jgi:hypothetical protein
MNKRCPHCGELVSGNSLNCPSCFKDIPRDVQKTEDQSRKEVRKETEKNRTFAIILALLFGAFGFMGLGHIYIGEHKRGLMFLIISLPLMVILALLVSNLGGLSFGGAVLTLGALLIFGIAYVGLYILHAISIVVSA